MKKLLSLLVLFSLLFSIAVAETENRQTVFKVHHVVKMIYDIHIGYYTGETENGVPNGYGLYEYIDYDKGFSCHYLGEWVNGEMCGSGGLYLATC